MMINNQSKKPKINLQKRKDYIQKLKLNVKSRKINWKQDNLLYTNYNFS